MTDVAVVATQLSGKNKWHGSQCVNVPKTSGTPCIYFNRQSTETMLHSNQLFSIPSNIDYYEGCCVESKPVDSRIHHICLINRQSFCYKSLTMKNAISSHHLWNFIFYESYKSELVSRHNRSTVCAKRS